MGRTLMGVLKFTIPMPTDVQPKIRGALGALPDQGAQMRSNP